MPDTFEYDRRFEFAVSPETFWTTVSRTEHYPTWWTWLREFRSDGLHDGAHAECVIQAPLPYALRVAIDVDRAIPPERIETRVTGDLDGPARLEITPTPSGCAARLVWSLELREAWLARVVRFTRPVLTWAHDRVISSGVRQFERVALSDAAPPG
ncbi:MAG TPA: SRPBCC family protein [Acidimicrobiia bacterium]|nr:SRPBCC family protein [Acidimicrobiia bacterium]